MGFGNYFFFSIVHILSFFIIPSTAVSRLYNLSIQTHMAEYDQAPPYRVGTLVAPGKSKHVDLSNRYALLETCSRQTSPPNSCTCPRR